MQCRIRHPHHLHVCVCRLHWKPIKVVLHVLAQQRIYSSGFCRQCMSRETNALMVMLFMIVIEDIVKLQVDCD